MEQVNLTNPIVRPNVTNYHISELILDWDNSKIVVQLKSDRDTLLIHSYEGDTAKNLMIALNKVNLSTRSLNQRIFDRLIADGVLIGNVAGSVD